MRTSAFLQSFLNFWERLKRVINRFVEPHPSVETLEDKRRVRLFLSLNLFLSATYVFAIVAGPQAVGTFVFLLALNIVSFFIGKTKYYSAGIFLFTLGFLATSFVSLYMGMTQDFAANITSIVPVALVIAATLVNQRQLLFLALFSAVAIFTAPFYSATDTGNEAMRLGGIVMSTGILLYIGNAYRANTEKERLKEIESVNQELQDVRDNLEKRVEERTAEVEKSSQQTKKRVAELQAIAELSQTIALEQDLDQLLPLITKLISERLGFYHVGIFLLDETREYAILQAANSEGGARMLTRGHRLKVGATGMVGYVTQSGRPRIALDVGADAVFFNNPDLPNTHSEAALPLKTGQQVVGALDVQSMESAAFTAEDVDILSALANQVSTAIQNARLYEQTRSVLRGHIESNRKGWQRLIKERESKGYTFRPDGSVITAASLRPETQNAIASGQTVAISSESANERTSIAVPVKVRDQIIGILNVQAHDANRVWTENEIVFLQTISERAAFALENARLFEETGRRAARERAVGEISEKISASSNFNRILQTTVQEIGRSLGASRAFIQVGAETSHNGNGHNPD